MGHLIQDDTLDKLPLRQMKRLRNRVPNWPHMHVLGLLKSCREPTQTQREHAYTMQREDPTETAPPPSRKAEIEQHALVYLCQMMLTSLALFCLATAVLDGVERLTAEEMDERRQQNMAYEYLCHLEEAKR